MDQNGTGIEMKQLHNYVIKQGNKQKKNRNGEKHEIRKLIHVV